MVDFSAWHTITTRVHGFILTWVERCREFQRAPIPPPGERCGLGLDVAESLFGANYKSAYCLAVCPAGEDVISPFLADRKQFLHDVVQPLQNKEETLYVVAQSDAEDHAARRFPHKPVKRIGNGLRPRSIQGFLRGLPLTFQRGRAKGLDATYHFTFTGDETAKATVIIRQQALTVRGGHIGEAKLHVTADTRTWLGFLARERSLVWALLRRQIRLKGSPRWLMAFGKCFPS